MTPGLIRQAAPEVTQVESTKGLRSASVAEMGRIKSFLNQGQRYKPLFDLSVDYITEEKDPDRRKSCGEPLHPERLSSNLTKDSSYLSLAQLKNQDPLKLPAIRNLNGVASMPSMPSIDSIQGSGHHLYTSPNLNDSSILHDPPTGHYLTANQSVDNLESAKRYSSVNLLSSNSEKRQYKAGAQRSDYAIMVTSAKKKKNQPVQTLAKNLKVHQSQQYLDPSARLALAQYEQQDLSDIVYKYQHMESVQDASGIQSTIADTKANETSFTPLPPIAKFSRLSDVISQASEHSEEVHLTQLDSKHANFDCKDAYKTENVKWDSFKNEYEDLNARAAIAKDAFKNKGRLLSVLSEYSSKKQTTPVPIIGDKYEFKLKKASPYLEAIQQRRMLHRELKGQQSSPNESLYIKHHDKDMTKFAKQKRKKNDQDLAIYLGVKPSYGRQTVIKATQARILPTKVDEDPDKRFIHKNHVELEDYYHTKQGVKNRVPLKEQGVRKEDIDPVGYQLDRKPSVKKVHDRQSRENLGMKDVYHLIEQMFTPFQGKEFRSQKLRHDLVHQRTLFYAKLDQMGQEFDEAVGARIAHLLYFQACVNAARKERIEKFNSLGHPEMAKSEVDELNFKDGTVFLDDLMNLDGSDEAYVEATNKIGLDDKQGALKLRVTKIAEHCKKFLTELKIFPKCYKEFFSSEQIAAAHKTEGGFKSLGDYEQLVQYIDDKPFLLSPTKKQIEALKNDPHKAGDRKNIIAIGGLEFYVNHTTKECIPLNSLDYFDAHSPNREQASIEYYKGVREERAGAKATVQVKQSEKDFDGSAVSFGSPMLRNYQGIDTQSQVTWKDIEPAVVEANFIP